MKEIDLNSVNLSPAAVKMWDEITNRIAIIIAQMADMGREIPPIPDEKGRVNDDGTLTVFVNIPGILTVSMDIPADQWEYRH